MVQENEIKKWKDDDSVNNEDNKRRSVEHADSFAFLPFCTDRKP